MPLLIYMKIKSNAFLDCPSFRLKSSLKWAQDRLNSFLCNDPSFEVDAQDYLGTIYRHRSSSNCLQTARYLVKNPDNTWEVMLQKIKIAIVKLVYNLFSTLWYLKSHSKYFWATGCWLWQRENGRIVHYELPI